MQSISFRFVYEVLFAVEQPPKPSEKSRCFLLPFALRQAGDVASPSKEEKDPLQILCMRASFLVFAYLTLASLLL